MSQRQSFSSQSKQPPIAISFNVLVFNFANKPKTGHTIFAFMIPALLSFLQIQRTELNQVAVMASLGSLVAYYMAFRAKLLFPNYASLLGFLMSVFGSSSVATLVCLILPSSWWCPRYVVFMVLMVGELLHLVHMFHRMDGRGLYWPPWEKRPPQPVLPLFNLYETNHRVIYW